MSCTCDTHSGFLDHLNVACRRGLSARGLPDARDSGHAHATLDTHRACAPVRRCARQRLQRCDHHAFAIVVRSGSGHPAGWRPAALPNPCRVSACATPRQRPGWCRVPLTRPCHCDRLLLPLALGLSGLRDETAAPVAVPEPQGAHGEVCALPGRAPMAVDGVHAAEGADGQLCVGEGIISCESQCGKPHAGLDDGGEETRSRWRLRHWQCGFRRGSADLPGQHDFSLRRSDRGYRFQCGSCTGMMTVFRSALSRLAGDDSGGFDWLPATDSGGRHRRSTESLQLGTAWRQGRQSRARRIQCNTCQCADRSAGPALARGGSCGCCWHCWRCSPGRRARTAGVCGGSRWSSGERC